MSFYNKTVLDNGIRVLSEHIPNVRSVAFGIWVGVGSRDEQTDNAGVSHFLEHLMFKGTPTRTSREISESFETLGAEINAFTTKEATAFYTRILDEHFESGFVILADMLQNSLFNQEDIKAEKLVVLEEISMHEDSPDELIHDLFSDCVYKEHPLGKRILGSNSTVNAFDRESVTNYYSNKYIPQNIVISAAGNITHEKLIELANKFITIPSSDVVFERRIEDALFSPQLMVANKKTEQAHIALGGIALSATDNDRFVLSVLDNILGGGMSSRLFWEIREKRGLAYSVYTYHSVHEETGCVCLYAGTNTKNAKEVISIMHDEIDKMCDVKVSEKEIYRSKQHIKGQLVLGLESTSNRMMRLGKSELTQKSIYSIDDLIKKIDSVDDEDILRVAKRIFQKEKLSLAIVGPYTAGDFSYLNFKKEISI